MIELIVIEPFEGLEKGHRITDPDVVTRVLESEHAAHVVPVPTDPT